MFSIQKIVREAFVDMKDAEQPFDLEAVINNENFQKWFVSADDLLKNSDGTPKVFYHGTSTTFDEFRVNPNGDCNFSRYYFTEDVKYAKNYATKMIRGEKKILRVFLNAKKIFDTRKKQHFDMYIDFLEDKEGLSHQEIDNIMNNDFIHNKGTDFKPYWKNYKIINFAFNNGFNGILIGERPTVDSICLFEKENIKSIESKDFEEKSTKIH